MASEPQARLRAPTAHSISVTVAVAVIPTLHIVLGELTPRTVARVRLS